MSTIAVRRTPAVLLATLLAVVACYTAFAHTAKAADRPELPSPATEEPGKRHNPEIASGVKFVRNADGTVTQTR